MLDADPYAAFSSPVDSSPAPAASSGPASAPTTPGTLAQPQDQPAPDINAVIARNARYQQIANTQGADGVIAALKAEGVDPATIDEKAIRDGVAAHAAVSTIGVPQKPVTATPPQDPSDPYGAFSSPVDSKPRDTGADAAPTSAPAASREAQTPVEGIGGGARNFLESGGDLLNTLTLPVRAPMAALGLPVDYAKDAADLADKLGLSHIDGVAGAIQKGMSLGLLTAGAAAPLAGAEGLVGGVAKAMSSTPVADTLVNGASQGAGENAREHGAGVLGQTAAEIGAGLAGGVVAAHSVPREMVPDAPTQAAQIKQAAADENIRILPQDVGSDGVKRATAWAAQTPFGAKTVAQAADNMYGDFRDRVGELAGQTVKPVEVGDTVAARSQQTADRAVQAADRTSGAIRDNLATPVDQTAAGQLIQRNVSRFMDDTAERTHKLYEAIPITANRPAQIGATRQFLNDANSEWQSNPQLGALFQNGRLASYLDALTPNVTKADTGLLDAAGKPITRDVTNGGALDWQDLKEFRTHVGDMLANPRLDEKIAPRQLQGLYASLSKDMEATARDAGAYTQWRRANNFADGRMKRINDTFSAVLGARKDATPNEAYAAMQAMLRSGSTGNAAAFARIMRSMPAEDANAVRASIVLDARGGSQFDPDKLAKTWGAMSERGKSALLPQPGMRQLMDDAAARAVTEGRNPFAGKSGEQVFSALEAMAKNRGDSMRFRATMAKLSPEEASSVRAAFINEGGKPTAANQNADDTGFSIAKWFDRYHSLSDSARDTLFGDGELRKSMDNLSLLAQHVKASAKMAGHSNTGAINNVNATMVSVYGGLSTFLSGLVTGHLGLAAGGAAAAGGPALVQRISAEALTSPRLLNWLAKAPTKPNPAAEMAHLSRLTVIAKAEPAIANSVISLQRYLEQRMGDAAALYPDRAAADRKRDRQ